MNKKLIVMEQERKRTRGKTSTSPLSAASICRGQARLEAVSATPIPPGFFFFDIHYFYFVYLSSE
jgi:hypothetical protein